MEQIDADNRESVFFYSGGAKLAAELFFPTAPPPREEGYPAVVVCHGWGGIKKFFVGDIARALAAQGFVSIAFDFRGFGESEGQRHRIFPLEQVADTRAAIAYLTTRPEVDSSRIAAYGTSFGGGIALEAASWDERIKATVCAVGIGNCENWLRGLRPYWQWLEFRERLAQDEIRRVTTGESELVEPEEIMVRDPKALDNEAKLRAQYPDRAFKLTLESGQAVLDFKPIERVQLISPRGTMFIGIKEDALCPIDETLALYQRALEPKRFLVLRGLSHHEIYEPQHILGVLETCAAFFRECMA